MYLKNINLEHMRKRTANREQECQWSQELGPYMEVVGFVYLNHSFILHLLAFFTETKPSDGAYIISQTNWSREAQSVLNSQIKDRLLKILINRTPCNEMKPIFQQRPYSKCDGAFCRTLSHWSANMGKYFNSFKAVLRKKSSTTQSRYTRAISKTDGHSWTKQFAFEMKAKPKLK